MTRNLYPWPNSTAIKLNATYLLTASSIWFDDYIFSKLE